MASNFTPIFLTDFYNLTMAYAYWKKDLYNTRSVFHFTFRRNPFNGGFIVFAGIETAIKAILEGDKFSEEDAKYLEKQRDSNGDSIFDKEFIDYLSKMDFSDCDIYSVKEGTVVFPLEPVIRVEGPIIKCQILETLLLNIVGFQSLVATKAARICMAAGKDPVIELGMRHAHGLDGAISASRAAFIGGCQGTSNVIAGNQMGIPLKGTQSHSWIMFFEDEKTAFKEYSDVFADNTFLVDTYSTIKGVENAVIVAKQMKKGKVLKAIRLDSGDLSDLSIRARKLLYEEGFKDTRIIASNELDEHIIASIKQEGCAIDYWGVGTKLITGNETPAASCVYKLSAIKRGEQWQQKMKLSEQIEKISFPGIQKVTRYYDTKKGVYEYDMISNNLIKSESSNEMKAIYGKSTVKIDSHLEKIELLQPVMKAGSAVCDFPSLKEIQELVKKELKKLPTSLKRFINPDYYLIGLEKHFYEQSNDLMNALKDKQ